MPRHVPRISPTKRSRRLQQNAHRKHWMTCRKRGKSLPADIGLRRITVPRAISRGAAEENSSACVREVWCIACSQDAMFTIWTWTRLVMACNCCSYRACSQAYPNPEGEVHTKEAPRCKHKQYVFHKTLPVACRRQSSLTCISYTLAAAASLIRSTL